MQNILVTYEKFKSPERKGILPEVKSLRFSNLRDASEWITAIKQVDHEIQYKNFKVMETQYGTSRQSA